MDPIVCLRTFANNIINNPSFNLTLKQTTYVSSSLSTKGEHRQYFFVLRKTLIGHKNTLTRTIQ